MHMKFTTFLTIWGNLNVVTKDAEFIETYMVNDCLGPFHVNSNEVAQVNCTSLCISCLYVESMTVSSYCLCDVCS